MYLAMKIEKIRKIEEKEDIKVVAQLIDCSNKHNPNGLVNGCRFDCSAPNEYPWYGSPDY